MIRTQRVTGLLVAIGWTALLAAGYDNAANAGGVAVCAPVHSLPPVCQAVQPVLPAPPVCQAVQPAPAVCAQVVLHDHLASVLRHLHAIVHHPHVHYVTAAVPVCQAVQPAPAVCQPAKRVLPPPPVCQAVQPAPAVCGPAKQISLLPHFLHQHAVYSYTTEQPVVAPAATTAAPALAPVPSAPKPPAPPVKST
jgi:hypothetical protein